MRPWSTVIQQKTGHSVAFKLTGSMRAAIAAWRGFVEPDLVNSCGQIEASREITSRRFSMDNG